MANSKWQIYRRGHLFWISGLRQFSSHSGRSPRRIWCPIREWRVSVSSSCPSKGAGSYCDETDWLFQILVIFQIQEKSYRSDQTFPQRDIHLEVWGQFCSSLDQFVDQSTKYSETAFFFGNVFGNEIFGKSLGHWQWLLKMTDATSMPISYRYRIRLSWIRS